MKRVPLVVGNWKMNHTATDAAAFAERLRPLLAPFASKLVPASGGGPRLELALAPAFPALERLGRGLAGTGVGLAAQNVHEAVSGAFTGEVSLAMLEDLDCRYVLVGHSERRQLFGETEDRIAAKLAHVAPSKVRSILCVGETLAEREAGAVERVLARQLAGPIRLFSTIRDERGAEVASRLVVAYEPVWAIGTGQVATPETAQSAHAEIRRQLEAGLGEAGRMIRILYGGSVKPTNAPSLLEKPDVDGALVGGASLDPKDFASIVSTCVETRLEPARC